MYLQLGLHYVSLLDVNFDKEEKDAELRQTYLMVLHN